MGGSKKYAILLLIAGGALLVLILYRTIVFVSEHIETALAREDARSYAKIISDVQVYYATEVVAHAKKNGIKIAKDYKKWGDAIPYPATFTHGLADKLNAKYGDLNFRLYSDAPFYERPRGDGLSAFDREALEHFRKTDENEIYRIEAGAAGPQFRFARAVRMGESCVECHNSHPRQPAQGLESRRRTGRAKGGDKPAGPVVHERRLSQSADGRGRSVVFHRDGFTISSPLCDHQIQQ